MCIEEYRKRVIIALVVMSIGFLPASVSAAECPVPPQNHIPAPPSPPLNIDTVKTLLLEYHQRYYDDDVAAVFDVARAFVERNANQSKRLAVILDIDETSLSNWDNILADNFGFIPGGSCDQLPAGPCGFNAWVSKSSAQAIQPALKLFNLAKAKGMAVIFITGRRDKQRAPTILNLIQAGFENWTELRTRPDRDDLPSVQVFKTAERIKVETEGFTILANIGDQFSDLDGDASGDHSGCRFKLPNPFYFIQ